MALDTERKHSYSMQEEIPCHADIGVTEEELEMFGEGTRAFFQQMSASGPGFDCYGPEHKRYGRSEVIKTLKHVGKMWHKEFPNGPRLGIGNISYQGGGRMDPHTSHTKGVDVDIAPVANTHEEIPLTWDNPKYSRERTQKVVDLFRNNPYVDVKTILFNDPDVKGVKPYAGHDNHLHVSFYPSAVTAAEFSSDQEGSLRLIAPFMKGERVRKLQEGLAKVGIEVTVDSIFGEGTDAAVRAFQAKYGLEVDGKAGSVTLATLKQAKNQTAAAPAGVVSGSSSAPGMALQAIIDQNRVIDFSDVNDSELIDDQDLCREVQAILQAVGLVGTIDGLFGSRTQGGLRSFKARYQLSGGDVLDAATATALISSRPAGGVLPNWQGGDKRATIQAIIQEAKRQGITVQDKISYILATVEHETANSFQPVRESYYLGEPKAENHRKTLRYYPYYGRGYVQLTWDYNYRTYSTLIGLDLVNQPDLVMRPDIALYILIDGMKRGVFTGVGLDDYFTGNRSDFVNARRIINGTDKANEIADLAMGWSSNLA